MIHDCCCCPPASRMRPSSLSRSTRCFITCLPFRWRTGMSYCSSHADDLMSALVPFELLSKSQLQTHLIESPPLLQAGIHVFLSDVDCFKLELKALIVLTVSPCDGNFALFRRNSRSPSFASAPSKLPSQRRTGCIAGLYTSSSVGVCEGALWLASYQLGEVVCRNTRCQVHGSCGDHAYYTFNTSATMALRYLQSPFAICTTIIAIHEGI
jgi:hypothetical protein